MSAMPIAIYTILMGAVSAFALIFGDILEPIVNMMNDSALKTFIGIVWPYGFMFACFLALTAWLLQHMQKSKYESGGEW